MRKNVLKPNHPTPTQLNMGQLVSRNVCIFGKRTSIRLEKDMWGALEEIANIEKKTIHEICTIAQESVCASSATSAVRLYLLLYFKRLANAPMKNTIVFSQAV